VLLRASGFQEPGGLPPSFSDSRGKGGGTAAKTFQGTSSERQSFPAIDGHRAKKKLLN